MTCCNQGWNIEFKAIMQAGIIASDAIKQACNKAFDAIKQGCRIASDTIMQACIKASKAYKLTIQAIWLAYKAYKL